MAAGQQYKATYDFKSTGEGILSFQAGDQFILVSKVNSDWWSVRTTSGDIGLAPVSYIEACPIRNGGPIKSVAYTSMYDYTAQDSTQLSFKYGDTLYLVDKTDVSWWTMRTKSGESGLVPVNYIDKLDTSDEPMANETDGSTPQTNGDMDDKALEEVLKSIDSNIERIHQAAANQGGTYTPDQKSTLQKLVMHRKNMVDSHKATTAPPTSQTTTPPSHTATPTTTSYSTLQSNHSDSTIPISPSKSSPSPVSSPKKSYNSPIPRRKAPPPPSAGGSGTSSSRSKSVSVNRRKGLKKDNSKTDYRYSLQVDSNEVQDHDQRRFGSLPRKHAPNAPAMRREPSPNKTLTSSSRSPLHSSASSRGGGMSDLSGTSSFKGNSPSISRYSPPRKTSADGLIDVPKSASSPVYGRRHSEDAGVNRIIQKPLASRTYSTSYVGEGESGGGGLTVMNSPKKSGGSPGSPRKRMSVESYGSESSYSHYQQRSRSASRDSSDILLEKPEPKIELPTSFGVSDGTELVEAVRTRAGVSYRKSLLAVGGVLEFLKNKVPVCAEMVDGLLSAVQKSQAESSPSQRRKMEGSSDLERLKDIFFEITECKDDSQQRGWAVHDDEQAITEILEELLQILCDANPDISKKAVEVDKYENVLTLITYYQMEPRIPIRLLLLKVFGVLCSLDKVVIGILLTSVLPSELGRDMQQNLTEIQKTLYSSTVCTMIFSTAEAVPLPLYDQWSKEYVLFLMDTIESPPNEDEEEQIPDAFLNVILSFNQHFTDPSTNLVMKALEERPNPRNFSEKLMFLVNRGEDPVAITEPCCPDSMTKFLLDVFHSKTTSGMFYTTDMMVLIDIVTRQITDLGAGEETRTHYLELLFRIVGSTNYTEHKHRQHDIISSLNRIAQEEGPDSQADGELVKKIWVTYPSLFEEITDL